jgi:hypothetical protein
MKTVVIPTMRQYNVSKRMAALETMMSISQDLSEIFGMGGLGNDITGKRITRQVQDYLREI